ncbi:MAG: hypothetical protein Q7V88_18650 [Actinomycetota bacterium]|nr:hypothetical protein [Actinomycetota bacterium]
MPIDSCHIESLHAAELALVAIAVPSRQAEFATGRVLLRAALAHDGPILREPSRAMQLPPRWVASLAHDHGVAVVAVGHDQQFAAIGIDVEPDAPADDELCAAVLRADDPAMHPTAAFVMKEAAYKAWSTLGGRILGPLDVRLELRKHEFTAHFPVPVPGLQGVAVRAGGRWWALATVPAR